MILKIEEGQFAVVVAISTFVAEQHTAMCGVGQLMRDRIGFILDTGCDEAGHTT